MPRSAADLPSNELGLLLPAYDDEQLVELLDIRPGDRVLDVGGGAQPFARADVVVELHLHDNSHRGGNAVDRSHQLVQASVEALPFADGAFDVVVCRHVLEHVDDPARACAELARVGRRGFLETPSAANELLHGYPNHVWMVSHRGRGLHFAPKPFVRNPFANVTRALHYRDEDFRHRFEDTYRNVFCTQLVWDAPFDVEVEPRGPHHFDYHDPAQASVAHLDYALNYLAHGLHDLVPAEVDEHLRVAAELSGPRTLPAMLLEVWVHREQLPPGTLSSHVEELRGLGVDDLLAACTPTSWPAFVVTGTGRSGTGFTARLLTELGLPCGHETVHDHDGRHDDADVLGDASWLAVPHLHELSPGTPVVHQVRHPLEVLRSCLGIGLFSEPSPYLDVILDHCPQVTLHDDELGRAMAWWVHWNERVIGAAQAHDLPLLTVRLEDLDEVGVGRLLDHLGVAIDGDHVARVLAALPRDVNHRERGRDLDWDDLPAGPDRDRLLRLARRLGYDAPDPAPDHAVGPTAGTADDTPEVSVLVRTHDRPERLARCLASIAAAATPATEVVVVNDGGVDVRHVVDAITDLTVRLVEHDRNRGRSAALNTALAAARAPLACIVDDDDLVLPWHLTTLLAAAAGAPDAVVHARAIKAVEDDGGITRTVEFAGPVDHETLLVTNRLPIQTVLFSVDDARALGGWDEGLDVCEDWDFWLRLARLRPLREVPTVTSEYRVSADGDNTLTRQADAHAAATEEIWRRAPVDAEDLLAARDAHRDAMALLLT